MAFWRTAFVNLHYRLCRCHFLRSYPLQLHRTSLFLSRFNGSYHRRIARVGLIAYTYDHFLVGCLRFSNTVDIHHLPNSPISFTSLSIPILSYFLDSNVCITDNCLYSYLQQKGEEGPTFRSQSLIEGVPYEYINLQCRQYLVKISAV